MASGKSWCSLQPKLCSYDTGFVICRTAALLMLFQVFINSSFFSATKTLVPHKNQWQTAWFVLKTHPIFIRPFLQLVKTILNSTVLQITENIIRQKTWSWSIWFFHFIHPVLDLSTSRFPDLLIWIWSKALVKSQTSQTYSFLPSHEVS